jgi:hypothetical protein
VQVQFAIYMPVIFYPILIRDDCNGKKIDRLFSGFIFFTYGCEHPAHKILADRNAKI